MAVPQNHALDLSIVIPVYKNADTLESLYLRLLHVLEDENLQFEILFIDDACPQQSMQILRQLAEKDARLAILVMGRNIGQQRAVLAGLNIAEGNAVAIMDADLQDPPEVLPVLLETLREGFDVVFGGRAGKYEAGNRLLTSRLYKWTMHRLTDLPSDAGLFLVARQTLIRELLNMKTLAPNLVAAIGVTSARKGSIPIERAPRPTGKSTYTSWMRLMIGIRSILWVLAWKLGFPATKKRNTSHLIFPIQEKIGWRFQDRSPGVIYE